MSNRALKQDWEPARLGPAMAGTTVYAIVEAARTLLAERGYEALSMRDVAADAGITAAAIYRHFPKKNALIDFVVDDTLREFELLLLLARHAGTVLNRDDIFRNLRGIDYDGLDRSIDGRISKLRGKLVDSATLPTRIKTVWGKGYLLVPDAWGEPT